MEDVSFLLIAVGACLALALRTLMSGGRLRLVELLAMLTVAAVALAAFVGVFVGPVGDARRYHETINHCFASAPPCGTKLHEILWGLVSAFVGIGWALLYGFAIAQGLSLLARAAAVSWRTPLIAIFFLYSAYQIGNGMAEGTYFILLLLSVIYAHSLRLNLAAMALLGTFIAHIGNAPFMLYLLRFPRGIPLMIAGSGMALTIFAIGVNIRVEDFYSIVNKAGALISQEAAISAVETKAAVSMRDADTSYAEVLIEAGFPYSTRGIAYAIWLYLIPLGSGAGIFGFVLALLSTTITILCLWMARRSVLLLAIVVLSAVVFAPATFTPGIGLRHKVPLFLFLLMTSNPTALRDMAWPKYPSWRPTRGMSGISAPRRSGG